LKYIYVTIYLNRLKRKKKTKTNREIGYPYVAILTCLFIDEFKQKLRIMEKVNNKWMETKCAGSV